MESQDYLKESYEILNEMMNSEEENVKGTLSKLGKTSLEGLVNLSKSNKSKEIKDKEIKEWRTFFDYLINKIYGNEDIKQGTDSEETAYQMMIKGEY